MNLGKSPQILTSSGTTDNKYAFQWYRILTNGLKMETAISERKHRKKHSEAENENNLMTDRTMRLTRNPTTRQTIKEPEPETIVEVLREDPGVKSATFDAHVKYKIH